MIETKFQLLRKVIEFFYRNKFTRKISTTLYSRTLSWLFSNRGINSYPYTLRILGSKFTLHANWLDYTDSRILLEPIYEEPTSKFLYTQIQEGQTFVNLGSNIGFFPMYVASLQRNNKIISAEISSRNIILQKRSIAANNYNERISLFEGGISDKNDTVEFKQILMNSGSGSIENYFGTSGKEKDFIYITEQKPVIDLKTLMDRYGIQHIDHILLDIQGSEDRVIRSSLDLIQDKKIKNIIIEYTKTKECDDLFTSLKNLGLKLYKIDTAGIPQAITSTSEMIHASNYLFTY